MRKVFVVNRGCHDHSDAERFGELVFLSEGAINRYAVANMYREFVQQLRNSQEEDFLLITDLRPNAWKDQLASLQSVQNTRRGGTLH